MQRFQLLRGLCETQLQGARRSVGDCTTTADVTRGPRHPAGCVADNHDLTHRTCDILLFQLGISVAKSALQHW
jgi:hypothetical protein